jgi:hypothetical protein
MGLEVELGAVARRRRGGPGDEVSDLRAQAAELVGPRLAVGHGRRLACVAARGVGLGGEEGDVGGR